jgi:hypothetical protein
MNAGSSLIAAALVKVLWSSVLASLAVAVTFSVAILGIVRGSEMQAANRGSVAFAYRVLAFCALCGFAGSVVYGLVLVTQKS